MGCGSFHHSSPTVHTRGVVPAVATSDASDRSPKKRPSFSDKGDCYSFVDTNDVNLSQTSWPSGQDGKAVSVSDSVDSQPTILTEDSGQSPASPASPDLGVIRMKRSTTLSSMSSMSSQMSLSRVAAGHGGVSILRLVSEDDEDPQLPRCVMKVYDETEASVYKELADSSDKLQRFTAEFLGEVDAKDIPEDLEPGSRYMKLTNLLKDFHYDPHVMDCKLGVRSFAEEEVFTKKLRKDLYTKMRKIDATAPTAEENEAQACTKYRWMEFNDSLTTTRQLGVRIDGITNADGDVAKRSLKLLQSIADMSDCIVVNMFQGHQHADANAAAASLLASLKEIREALMTSAFASRHCFVGMSLLFIVEQCSPFAAVYLIDFAKTFPLPDNVSIDHRTPWVPGNHEDGILIGMDNMILCWEQVLAQLSEKLGTETQELSLVSM